MANIVAPQGFQPVRGINTYQGQTNIYFIPSGDGSVYSIGDAVKSVANGDPSGIPAVQKSTGASGEFQRGVVVGVLPVQAVGTPSLIGTPLSLETINVPATKTRGYYIEVCDDPNQLYEIQDDGSAALTATSCNKNATFTAVNPTAPLQISQSVLVASTVNTTAAFPLKMMGLSQRVAPVAGNSFGTFAKWIVKFNNHELNGASTAGV